MQPEDLRDYRRGQGKGAHAGQRALAHPAVAQQVAGGSPHHRRHEPYHDHQVNRQAEHADQHVRVAGRISRNRGHQPAQEEPQRSVIDRGDTERVIADPPPQQVHLAQHRAEHRQRGDPDADADRDGEPDRADAAAEFARLTGGDPQPAEKARGGRHRDAGASDHGEGAAAAKEVGRIEVQSGDKAEQQHGDRGDPPKRRQRRRIEEQMVGFGCQPAEQGRAEGDPDQDLDDDERHRTA